MVLPVTNGNNVEKKVLDIFLDHTRIVNNSVKILMEIIDCWKTPGRIEFNKNVKQLYSLEIKADNTKNSAMKEISDAGPVLLFRQDLMRIIRTSDQIVDLAHGAAYFLDQLDPKWIPPESLVKNVEELIENAFSVTKLLIDLNRALYQNLDKVIEISETIEMIEYKADELFRALIVRLATLDGPKGASILIRESINRIEEMIDSGRDVATYIRTYAMSR